MSMSWETEVCKAGQGNVIKMHYTGDDSEVKGEAWIICPHYPIIPQQLQSIRKYISCLRLQHSRDDYPTEFLPVASSSPPSLIMNGSHDDTTKCNMARSGATSRDRNESEAAQLHMKRGQWTNHYFMIIYIFLPFVTFKYV